MLKHFSEFVRLVNRLLFFFVLLLLAAAENCLSQQQSFKIGVMLCLTGDCAEWGTNGLRGARLAAKQINAAGGVLGRRLELVVQDSHDTTPANAVTVLRKLLLDREINYLVGPTWTVGGMAVAPIIAGEKNLIVTSPSVGVRDFNESARNILNVWPHDEIATRRLAQYAYSMGWEKAAIFGSQDPWVRTQSATFEEEFVKLGGSISTRVEPLPGSRELKAEAIKIKNSSPDVVFFANYQVDVMARELLNLKFNAPKLAILMEKDRVKSANGALEDTVFALYQEPADEFKQSFLQEFGVDPGITADTAYDVIQLYAHAIRTARSFETSSTLPQLLSVRNFKGASGSFSINEKGAVDKKPVLWTVKGLDYVQLD